MATFNSAATDPVASVPQGEMVEVFGGARVPIAYDHGFVDGLAASPPPDAVPPVVTIISPTPGVAPGAPGGFPRRRADAILTPIVLRVGDAAPGLAYLNVTVRFYGSAAELAADQNGVEEEVYRRGGFRGKHVHGSSAVPDGADLVLTVMRQGGWLGRYIKFAVDPIDGAGNLT